MNRFSTLRATPALQRMSCIFSLKRFTFLCAVLLVAVAANSQCTGVTACETNIDESFTGGPGSFRLGDQFSATNGSVRSPSKGSQNKILDTLHSAIYTAGAQGSVLTYRFTLGAINNGTVSSYKILARYDDRTTGGVIVLCSGTTLTIGSPLCFNYTVNQTLAANSRFRFEFIFTLSGSDNQARLTFDDFATNAAEAPSQAPLPVTFTSFEGRKVATGTQLSWKVAGESHTTGYEIERRTATSQFTKIGFVPATGNNTYSFIDASASPNIAVQYRLRTEGQDGDASFSTILSFQNGKGAILFQVLPTVVRYSTTAQHAAAGTNALLSLSTADGKQVKLQKPQAGSIQTEVNMAGLRPGIYLLRFSDGNGTVQTVKLLKQ